jgi:hypothetical protein
LGVLFDLRESGALDTLLALATIPYY